MKKIKQEQKESDQERTEYEALGIKIFRDYCYWWHYYQDWVGNYDHIDYSTYEFEPNKKSYDRCYANWDWA